MFGDADLKYELDRVRKKMRKGDDTLVSEAKKILKQDLFTESKVLQHLKHYKSSFEMPDEEDLDPGSIFTLAEIKRVAVIYRLKFLEGNLFKPEIPYEASTKISKLNDEFHKEIKEFKVLSPNVNFREHSSDCYAMLFVKTNYDNYYLIHAWGKTLKKTRKYKFVPLRSFDNLVISVVLVTLFITVSLPTRLITLDHSATYWSGYRAAAFFHLLIFNFGVTVYLMFAFARNFSSTIWNRYKDF